MVQYRQKVWMDGRTHGRRKNYIPLTSSGDNNQEQHSVIPDLGLNCYQQMIKVAASKERVNMYICKFV